MSNIDQFPMCDDMKCDHPYRLEYCREEAKEPDGDAAVVIEMLDHLLYESGKFVPNPQCSSDGRVRYVERTFSFLHGDIKTWVWPLLETTVSVAHHHNVAFKSDEYVIRVGWVAHQQGASSEQYQTVYTLSQWPHTILSTVDEYDLSTERLKDLKNPELINRPATPYDFDILYRHLDEVERMCIATDSEAQFILSQPNS